MTLTNALNAARSSLTATSTQSALVSRNIANANNANASRKSAKLVTPLGGGVYVASITRASNDALTNAMLDATAKNADTSAIVSALNQLNTTIGDTSDERSPAALVGKLESALQRLSASPQTLTTAQTAVAAARDLATALNSASTTVTDLRVASDKGIADSVASLNTLLSRFGELNTEVVNGTLAGQDVTDALDHRDQLLSEISSEIGIKLVRRANNDIAIYTDSGVTLFETKARTVTFQSTANLGPGMSGRSVYVDGVPVTGSGVAMGIESGRIAGLARTRDEVTVTYQSQIDEIARGLIEAFAESDQTGSGLPDQAGLFTYAGGPGIPTSGQILNGIAGSIKVAASVDPDQGGDANRLRDGAISDPLNPAYLYNTSGGTGFTGRLSQLQANLRASRNFDPIAQAQTSTTVANFAASSAGWLQEQRKVVQAEADYAVVMKERATSALSNETGVNIDTEMSNMLELERSYQATAKVISTIDTMFGALMSAIG